MTRNFLFQSLILGSVYVFSMPMYTAESYEGKEEELFNYLKEQENDVLDKSFGLVIGAATGDSLGSFTEFSKTEVRESVVEKAMTMPGGGPHQVAPGQITDDTELALSLSRGLYGLIESLNTKNNTDGSVDFDSSFIAKRYYEWLETGPFDKGDCTESTLTRTDKEKVDVQEMKKHAKGYNLAKANLHENEGNMANGSLMRCMPLIVYGYKLNHDQLFALMAEDSSLTHANPVIYYANTAYAIAVQHLLNSDKPIEQREEKVKEAFNVAKQWLLTKQSNKAAQKVYEWLENAEKGDTTKFQPATPSLLGFIRIAFERTFYHLKQGSPFKEAMEATIKEGGDTDTNCCIVGGAIGASYGYAELRKHCLEYVTKVIECDQAQGDQKNRKNYHTSIFIETIPKIVKNAPKNISTINTKDIEEIIASLISEQPLNPSPSSNSDPKQNLTPIVGKQKKRQKNAGKTNGEEGAEGTASESRNNELSFPTFSEIMFGLCIIAVIIILYNELATLQNKKRKKRKKKRLRNQQSSRRSKAVK